MLTAGTIGTPALIAAHNASQQMDVAHTTPVHDALCVALLLDPEVVQITNLHVDVETSGELTLGRSVIDVHRRSGKPANSWVALSASPKKFVALLLATFASRAAER